MTQSRDSHTLASLVVVLLTSSPVRVALVYWNEKMKAVICTSYGGSEVLQLEVRPLPVIHDHEYLVKVYASSATTADWRIRSRSFPKGFGFLGRLIFGLNKPRQVILGSELSGIVVERGALATEFNIGDEVIVQCGAKMGAYVEYKTVSDADCIIRKPGALNFEEAAVFSFGASAAWAYLIEKAMVEPGQKVLIHGASGSVGSAAVQIAKAAGAEVTAVCSHSNGDLVRELGADHVLDYQTNDFRKTGEQYDFIFDTTGQLSFMNSRHSLSKNGKLLLVSADLPQMLQALIAPLFGSRRVVTGVVNERRERLLAVVEMIKKGRYRVVVDKVFPLELIASAHRYIEKRHRRGNVAIRM